jgi:hypothetical protein
MPAKFVNLIEFFELEIFLQMKAVRGVGSGIDGDGIVLGFDAVDLGPDEEAVIGQGGDGDAAVVYGEVFVVHHSFFEFEQVEVSEADDEVEATHEPAAFYEQGNADACKEQYFYQPEKEVHHRHIRGDVFARHHQYKNIQRHKYQAADVYRAGLGLVAMGEGVDDEEGGGEQVQEPAGAFELLEGWVNNWER